LNNSETNSETAPAGIANRMSRQPLQETRPEALQGAPLHYAPQNELGVVFLFATLAKKWRLVVDKIQAAFPDCTVYQKVGGRDKAIRIEFEYRSSSAKYHRHDLNKCDWIVCWEHDWPQIPPHLQVIELRREFGLGFNVWMMPVDSPYKEQLSKIKGKTDWSVPRRAHQGDLLVFYRTRPDACISDIFKLAEDTAYLEAQWHKHVRHYKTKPIPKGRMDYRSIIRRVCSLPSPIFLEDLRRDRFLKTAGFVRGDLQGRRMVTEHWPFLCDLILRRNPAAVKSLSKYSPEHL
jgi:hypothetical protein